MNFQELTIGRLMELACSADEVGSQCLAWYGSDMHRDASKIIHALTLIEAIGNGDDDMAADQFEALGQYLGFVVEKERPAPSLRIAA